MSRWTAPALVFLGVLGSWYAMSYLVRSSRRRFLAPAPHDVVRVAFLDRRNLLELLDALWPSARVAMTGLGAATVLGMTAAVGRPGPSRPVHDPVPDTEVESVTGPLARPKLIIELVEQFDTG